MRPADDFSYAQLSNSRIICKNSEAVFQYNNPDGTLEIIKVGV